MAKKPHKRGMAVKRYLFLTAFLILLQIAFVAFSIMFFAEKSASIYLGLEVISIVIVFYILNKRGNPSYKITWIIYILVFPLVGGLIYLLWGGARIFPHVKKRMKKYSEGSFGAIPKDSKALNRLIYDDLHHSRQSTYLTKNSGYPVFDNTYTKYLAPGEAAFPVILEELEKAEKYIFIEMFILAEDSMFEDILKVLKRKKSQGVEIRIMFDDFGSITRQYKDFSKRLLKLGFEVAAFNKVRPSVNIFLNNRNHRKIIIIDGKVAFTGGMNIADEYLNRTTLHGYWMDCAVMLKGKAVSSFVSMFLSMWGFCTAKKQRYAKYIADYTYPSAGFVQPYCDGPINEKNPAMGLYMQILNTAQKYVYIATPYLIVDNTMLTALTLAASSGVDVRILTPGIPDKWYVHPVTQNSYGELLSAGVKIYEYTPGFIHSKFFVSDDKVATIGTVNMDYRSFFFHFECGVWMSGTETVEDVKEHFLQMLSESNEIKYSQWKKRPFKLKLKQAFLSLFAPFM